MRVDGSSEEVYTVGSGRSGGALRTCMASMRSLVMSETVHGNQRCLHKLFASSSIGMLRRRQGMGEKRRRQTRMPHTPLSRYTLIAGSPCHGAERWNRLLTVISKTDALPWNPNHTVRYTLRYYRPWYNCTARYQIIR